METKVKVTILPGGMTAREVNPLGETISDAEDNFDLFELPICFDPREEQKELYIRHMKIEREWKQAEDKCRVFTIDFMHSNKVETVMTVKLTKKGIPFIIDKESFIEGSTHEAEIIDEEKLIIKIL